MPPIEGRCGRLSRWYAAAAVRERKVAVGLLDSPLVRKVRQSPRLRPAGIAAYRAVDRVLPAGTGPRVLANSMPKSGTHLLATLLDGLGDLRFAGHLVAFDCGDRHDPDAKLADLSRRLKGLRNNRYLGGHLVADEAVQDRVAQSGVKLLTILRDPRAVIVSGANYVLEATQLRDRDEALALFPDKDAILRAMVFGNGEPGEKFYFPEIGERYAAYARWWDAPMGHTVRFEDLIGGRGGGDDDRQVDEVAGVLQYLGYGADQQTSRTLAAQLFSEKAITFRTGRIDSWREELPADLAAEVERRCAVWMDRLGYPS